MICLVEDHTTNISAKRLSKYLLLLETILQSFSFIPQTASEELILDFFFRKFCLLVAMVTNQIKRLQQKCNFVVDHSRNISVKVLLKYLQ